MILTRDGKEITAIYRQDGSEIEEVKDANGRIVYSASREIKGTLPLYFSSRGKSLTDYRIYGETLQDGTPSPDMPVDVVGCGEWDSAANSYKLPETTTNGTDTVTTPIYIGSEPLHRIGEYADYVDYASGKIVRRIKKLVLTGEENWVHDNTGTRNYIIINDAYAKGNRLTQCYCSHYTCVYNAEPFDDIPNDSIYINLFNNKARFFIKTEEYQTADSFKSYLAAQYTAGTPVTVWYVLSEPIEEDPPVPFQELPTLSGTNTLTVDTTVKPSEIDLTGRIKPTGYGQLLDKNLTAINDSTGTPIFIRG